QVEDDYRENTSVVKINGLPGVLLQVQKASSSNTVQVAQAVRAELQNLAKEMPAGVSIQKIMDQAEFIESSISNVERAALEGAVLAVILILLFLGNWRSTFIISLAIPISVVATFALLYFGKLTLNFATMGGLALGIGRLVDDAIVVLENIFRHMKAGERPREASLLGAVEVGNAVMAATFTTIVVFVPIFFVSGMAGVIFKPMAYTVSFSLFASLFVALMLIPVLTTKFLRVEKSDAPKAKTAVKRFNAWFNQWFEKVLDAYQRLLVQALRHRKRVIWSVAGITLLSFGLLPFVGVEFMPSSDEGEIEISFKAAIGTRLEVSEQVLNQLEKIVREKVPEIESSFGRVGVEGQGMGAMASVFGGISGSHAGQMRLQLVPRNKRTRTTDEVIEALRPELQKIPGADIKFAQQHSMSMSGDKPIAVEIQGYDLETGRELAQNILASIEKVPGVRDAEISREEGLPEMQIEIDRERAAQFGLSLAQVAQAIETAMAGKVATLYRDPVKGQEYNVLLRYQAKDRFSMQDLDRIFVVSPIGAKVSVANMARVKEGAGPVAIDRKNQERIITVSSQVSGRAPGDVAAEIQRRLKTEISVPNEFTVTVAGMYKDMVESFQNLLFALVLAILLVYMVLVAQFESLLDPFIIMFSVPLGIVGVIWGLFLSGYTLSVVSFLGIIMMAGIVVSNGILLVDFTNILRHRGKGLKEAVLEAGRTRLRPILMTSLTTILGMLPMALGLGEGGEVEAPMAVSVIFGLAASMVMTLVFIPTVYAIFEEKVKRSFKISDEAGA
ncbi:efflux RND transporter permease subunit, partial [candidate division FCPU426 bacterium]|nr:efflux RND transporter permease subunit [candidate division FCPU426 bacterium]